MTFSRLAWANVRGSLQRYLAYFLACVFAVMTFYVFLSFLTNPEVATGRIVHNARAEMNNGLAAAEIIILIFSFFFILYSTTTFVRARKKEFGLLTLLGMTQAEMRRMVFLENGIIAAAALAVGLGLGVLLSKLFFLAVAAVVQARQPIPFAVPLVAVAGTAAAFVGLFLSVNVFSLLGVSRASIRELLKAAGGPKRVPRRRPLLLLAGLTLLAAGYGLAWVTTGVTLVGNTLPILALTIAGTYFVVTQGSILVFGWLSRRTGFYLRGTNVLTVNRLVFRLTDTARVIFISAILIAVVGSSLGAFNSLLQGARRIALDGNAYALNVVVPDGGDPADVEARILNYLESTGVTAIRSQAIPYFRTEGEGLSYCVVSAVSYDRAAEMIPVFGPAALGRGEAILVSPYAPRGGEAEVVTSVTLRPSAVAAGIPFRVVRTVVRPWLSGPTVVVNDADFAALGRQATSRSTWLGFEFRGWEKHSEIPGEVNGVVGASGIAMVTARAEGYSLLRQSGALTMFIGLFIAVLFFVMAGSLIYFKLFTEIAGDRQQYAVLREIGLTRGEFGRVVSQELGTLFFLPVLFGAVHTAFALKTLSNLINLHLNIVGAGLMIGAAYLAAQTAYFLVTRAAYVRQVTAR